MEVNLDSAIATLMSSDIVHAALYLAVYLVVIYGARLLERNWPIADVPHPELRDDWLAAIVSVGLEHSLAPLAALSVATGLGGIHLPTEGYWWYASLAFVVVPLDLYKYTFHRLQHAIPFLCTHSITAQMLLRLLPAPDIFGWRGF
jgi:sterol desaturase/sphingolipid hydroxylase (fatty acid hydroxylase superfamily)